MWTVWTAQETRLTLAACDRRIRPEARAAVCEGGPPAQLGRTFQAWDLAECTRDRQSLLCHVLTHPTAFFFVTFLDSKLSEAGIRWANSWPWQWLSRRCFFSSLMRVGSAAYDAQDVAQKTSNPDAKVMADTLSTAVGRSEREQTHRQTSGSKICTQNGTLINGAKD